MYLFQNDYAEGAHPGILELLQKTNMEQTPGYGMDAHCERAAALIRRAIGSEGADIHFLVGGTQTNVTVLSALLLPYQGVISADSGHIHVHETGAVEHGGHKVLALPTSDGKLTAAQVEACAAAHAADAVHEHTVQPGCVYVSHPTETGMLYTVEELQALRRVCERWALPLFVDGARLGYALAAASGPNLAQLAQLCDVFYIGGTKVGALFGEAIVFTERGVARGFNRNFRYHIKQNGGMLAKGRLLGIQFEALFEDGLYLELGRRAVAQALRIREAFLAAGCQMAYDCVCNQQFPLVSAALYQALQQQIGFTDIEQRADGQRVIRLCTSWATSDAAVDELCAFLGTWRER